MNKRKRVATLKQRRRRKKYEIQRRLGLAAGTTPMQVWQTVRLPKTISAPLQKVVADATPARRARRAAAREVEITEVAPAVEAAVGSPAPARRTRRATAPPQEAAAAIEAPPKPAARTRRSSTPKTKEPAAETPTPASRTRRTATSKTKDSQKEDG